MLHEARLSPIPGAVSETRTRRRRRDSGRQDIEEVLHG